MLTVKQIENAKPRAKNYKLTDSKGLYAKLQKNICLAV